MDRGTKLILVGLGFLAVAFVWHASSIEFEKRARIKKTEDQLKSLGDSFKSAKDALDRMSQVQSEKDSWGTTIEFGMGDASLGFFDKAVLRSAGPDKTLRTSDDLVYEPKFGVRKILEAEKSVGLIDKAKEVEKKHGLFDKVKEALK